MTHHYLNRGVNAPLIKAPEYLADAIPGGPGDVINEEDKHFLTGRDYYNSLARAQKAAADAELRRQEEAARMYQIDERGGKFTRPPGLMK